MVVSTQGSCNRARPFDLLRRDQQTGCAVLAASALRSSENKLNFPPKFRSPPPTRRMNLRERKYVWRMGVSTQGSCNSARASDIFRRDPQTGCAVRATSALANSTLRTCGSEDKLYTPPTRRMNPREPWLRIAASLGSSSPTLQQPVSHV